MQYCAVCLVAKNESWYLTEWAEYHLRIGFDSCIIYDNGSDVPIRETLAPLVAIGRVAVHDMPGAFAQGKAYDDCMKRYADSFRWIAVIDADEMLFPKNVTNIKEFLAEYESYGAVAVNWVVFGSGGRLKRELQSQIFSFIHAEEEGNCTTIKTIAQPRKVKDFSGIHSGELLPPYYMVTSDHFPLLGTEYSAPFVGDAIQCNHYYFRTREDYEAKVARPTSRGLMRTPVPFDEEVARHPRKDTGLLKLYSRLRETPIQPPVPPSVPATVKDLSEHCLRLLEENRFQDLEIFLCDASLTYEDEPLVWVFRSISSRLRNRLPRALHCIKEACRLSGSSTVYYELSRVYEALGETDRAERALRQAGHKKRVEVETCA